MPRLRIEALSLVDLLARHARYTVPDFQRVYAWGEAQVKGLLADLASAMRADGDSGWLFLGTMFFACPKGADEAQIADGQQRILTLNMLIAALRDIEDDAAAADKLDAIIAAKAGYRFAPRNLDAAFFRAWVQERGATLKPFAAGARENDSSLSESQRNIIGNRDLIVKELGRLGTAGRRKLLAFLAEQAEVSVITAPTLEDARNAYASTQSRGLVQAEVDKLKAELLGDCEEGLRAELAYQWEECEASLGKEDFAELFEHLIFIASERKPQRALEADLTRVFGLPDKVAEFIEKTLVPSAAAYKRILTAGSAGQGLKQTMRIGKAARRIDGHLISLRRANHHTWKAPAILALRERADNQAALEDVLRNLERMAAVMMIAAVDPGDMLSRYAAVLRELKARSAGKGSAFAVERALLAKSQDVLRDPKMATHSRYRMAVLLKLNDLLNGEVEAVNPRAISCEHILPRNASKTRWTRDFKDARGGYSGEAFTHRIGNLAILSRADNRSADTKPFDVKRKILKKSGYSQSLSKGQIYRRIRRRMG